MTLTTRDIERLTKKHQGERVPLVRSLGKGLSVKITGAGNVAFILRFQYEGKAANLKIGDLPQTSIEEAEIIAEKCLVWLAAGADPRIMMKLESPAAAAGRFNVRQMVELWLTRSRRKDKETPLLVMERHIFPHVGDLPVDSVEVRHWIAVLDDVAQGTHTGRPAPAQARELLSMLKTAQSIARLLQRCTSRALDDIPASFIAEPGEAGTRTLASDELTSLLRWTTAGRAPDYYRTLVRLLLVFGARTVEVRLSNVREWDLKAMTWTVPPEHSKTGVEIIRPIPAAAVPMIKRLLELAKRSGSALLLRDEKTESAVSKYCRLIWQKLGHESEWSAHDLHRTFRTRLADLGVAPWTGEALLGHAVKGIEGTYNRAQMMNEKRQALTVWLDELNRLERTGIQLVAMNH